MNVVVAVVLVFAIIGLFFAAAAFLSKKSHMGSGAQIVQACVTSAALTLAGYLYFIDRKGAPHADVEQTVQLIPLSNDRRPNVLLEASVVVKNLGNELLRINHVRSTLQLVDLDRLGLAKLPTTNASYWDLDDVVNGQRGNAFDEGELQWANLRIYDKPVNHEIEPSESDLITISFLIPCQADRYVRVATDIEKIPPRKPTTLRADFDKFLDRVTGKKGESHAMAWKARSFVDLSSVCPKA